MSVAYGPLPQINICTTVYGQFKWFAQQVEICHDLCILSSNIFQHYLDVYYVYDVDVRALTSSHYSSTNSFRRLMGLIAATGILDNKGRRRGRPK